MLIWGRANAVLKVYDDLNAKCEECGHDSLNYVISQNFYHVFWIPAAPSSKFSGTYCDHCESSRVNVYSENAMICLKRTKTPAYLFTLPIVIILFFALIVLSSIFS